MTTLAEAAESLDGRTEAQRFRDRLAILNGLGLNDLPDLSRLQFERLRADRLLGFLYLDPPAAEHVFAAIRRKEDEEAAR